MATFPSQEWVQIAMEKINSDAHYAQVARNWEGDLRFAIEPEGAVDKPIWIYMDLWHGKCRQAFIEDASSDINPAFVLKAPYSHFVQIVRGELDPMQALLTRKLNVQGNLAMLLRNIPTVLDFVRCCREVTDKTL